MKLPSWLKRAAAVVVTTTLKLIAGNNKVDPAVVDAVIDAAKREEERDV